jgi:hypothetical protein
MTDEKETHVKSIMWTRFVPVNPKTGRKEIHPPSFMDFVNQVIVSEVDVQAGLKNRLSALVGAKAGQPA